MNVKPPVVVVHIGDLHLHAGPRQADRLTALDQIIAECASMPALAAWAMPGDLFDHRSGIDDRNELAARFIEMAGRAPVLVTYGNHDASGDLDIFADLAAAWPIRVVSTPEVLRLKIAGNAMRADRQEYASVFVLPYPTEAGLVARGVPPAEIPQAARVALEAIFIDAAARLDDARKAGDITFAMGHVNVAGSITSTGQPQIGQEIEIDAALIARLGNIPVLLNHIHKAQAVGGARYAGSVCRLSWGEVEPKTYDVVTFEWAEAGASKSA